VSRGARVIQGIYQTLAQRLEERQVVAILGGLAHGLFASRFRGWFLVGRYRSEFARHSYSVLVKYGGMVRYFGVVVSRMVKQN
jgi:hypothetical protein